MKNGSINKNKNKKKNILLCSNDKLAKNYIFNSIINNFNIIKEIDRENKEVTFELNQNKKKYIIKLSDKKTIDNNNNNNDYSDIYSKIK
jgi:hypothetical protein